MSLKEKAIQARKDQITTIRDQEAERVSRRLAQIKDPEWWEKHAKYKFSEESLPDAPTDVAWGSVYIEERQQIAKKNGVLFTIDEINFVYLDEREGGLRVLATCPDCGMEQAYAFYGLDHLGRIIVSGRESYGHSCRQSVAKLLAYQIGAAAGSAGTSVASIVDEAMQHHDQIARGMR